MSTPHKHAELIKAWADGALIEFHIGENEWDLVGRPSWLVEHEYRIKPEPKHDVVSNGYIYKDSWGMVLNTRGLFANNLKLTFDGETGKLKSAEVIS